MALLEGLRPKSLGLAVSGGGDSMAMLHLLAPWARVRGIALRVATVDHGLRPQAAEEAALVRRESAALGLVHDTLAWRGWSGQGNLQHEARAARHRLLAGWAREHGLEAVALGHTRDDQAETLLMRLARGSGVDGLSAMQPLRRHGGATWLRPLLGIGRAELRAWLRAEGISWAEDPSNEDRRFERVRVRKALDTLAGLGITREDLAATAERMQRARAALDHYTHEAARAIVRLQAGDVLIAAAPLAALPEEIRLRLVAHSLCRVSSADYRPRLQPLTEALADVNAGRTRSLHGALMRHEGAEIRIFREHAAVAGLKGVPGQPWDRRWILEGPENMMKDNSLAVMALGEEGLAQCAGWRETGLPRASLLASPAVWRGRALLAAPLAGEGRGWRARLLHGPEHYFATILSH